MGVGSHYDESAARLAAVAQLIDEALITADSRGAITGWNAAAGRLFGYTADDIVGRPFSSIVSLPTTVPDPQHSIELTGQHRDGTTLAISLSVAPIPGADGRPAGTMYVVRDPGAQARSGRAAKHLSAIVESSDDAIVSK